jgi:hypothetical protein
MPLLLGSDDEHPKEGREEMRHEGAGAAATPMDVDVDGEACGPLAAADDANGNSAVAAEAQQQMDQTGDEMEACESTWLRLTNCSVAAGSNDHTRIMCQPCVWPSVITAGQLADGALPAMLRDLSPLLYAACLAISCETSAARVGELPASLLASLRNLPTHHRDIMAYLPQDLLGEWVQVGQQQCASLAQRVDSAGAGVGAATRLLHAAHLAVWHGLPVLLERNLLSQDAGMLAHLMAGAARRLQVKTAVSVQHWHVSLMYRITRLHANC